MKKLNKASFTLGFGKQWLIGGSLLVTGFATQAAPLNLNLQLPDVTASSMLTNYDAVNDVFTANGFATSISYDGVTQNSLGFGAFSLTASISDGGVFSGGSFSVAATSGLTDILIAGTLLDFGFDNGSSVLEFAFDPTSGSLLAYYDAASYWGNGGIVLASSGYNDDNFNSDFANSSYTAVADIAPIPVPAAVWLFGSGLIGLAGVVRRKTSFSH